MNQLKTEVEILKTMKELSKAYPLPPEKLYSFVLQALHKIVEVERESRTKKCPLCKQTKPLESGFYKHERYHDGYDRKCKDCHNNLARQRLRDKYDPEKEKIRSKNKDTKKNYE